jgi:hypothetical protein
MSQVKKLTRLGSDTRKIAALLQAKAPKGEMLAYINPQEAALLRAHGGSGKPHADTGIPSFQVESDFSEGYMADMGRSDYDPQGSALYLEGGPATDYQMGYPEPTFIQPTISGGVQPAAMAPVAAPSAVSSRLPDYTGVPIVPGGGSPVEFTGTAPSTYYPPETYQDVFGAKPSATGGSGDSLKKLSGALGLDKANPLMLGLAGAQLFMGSRAARNAAQQGRAGKAEMQAMAAPYRQQGQQLQAQAARGELTPQAQQSLQAVQAQAAQGVQNRGGVGAAQAAAQVEAVRQQLLQAQSDYGLKLSGIGDQIALGAIRAGIQADQYVNNLTNSYMGNIMRLYGGTALVAPGGQR